MYLDSCLEESSCLNSVSFVNLDLCVLPNLGIFQPLFLWILFQTHPLFSFLLWLMKVRFVFFFFYHLRTPWGSINIFSGYFLFVVQIRYFLSFWSPVHWLFPVSHFVLSPSTELHTSVIVFFNSRTSILFFFISSFSLLSLSFCWRFLLFICFSHVVIACWSIHDGCFTVFVRFFRRLYHLGTGICW